MLVVNHGSGVWRLVDDISEFSFLSSLHLLEAIWHGCEWSCCTTQTLVTSEVPHLQIKMKTPITWRGVQLQQKAGFLSGSGRGGSRSLSSIKFWTAGTPPAGFWVLFWVIYANGRRQQPRGWTPPSSSLFTTNLSGQHFDAFFGILTWPETH